MDRKNEKTAETVLGPGSVFEGTLRAPHNVSVAGSFKGTLDSDGHINICKGSTVVAEVKAASATVGGTIEGNLVAAERVELEAGASLVGDLRTRDLVIHEGAIFHGMCSMKDQKNGK